MRVFLLTLAALGTLSQPALAQKNAGRDNAEDVDIKITVRAQDARIIGNAVGGAYVMIRDRRNGDILAEGLTAGSAGDEKTIMGPHTRDAVLSNDGSADLELSLTVLEPLPVTVSARAPLAQAQASVTVTQDMILIPGQDYSAGDGILLTVPGFAVDVTEPALGTAAKHDPNKPVSLRAHIAKLSGDRIGGKEGAWPSERYKVQAHIFKESAFVMSFDMKYGDEPGLFVANMKMPLPGTYRVIVSAFDPLTKESGIDTTTLTLE